MATPDLLMADIISYCLDIPAERVVLYSQDFDFPSDNDLFCVIVGGTNFVLSSVTNFDHDTNKEIQTATIFRNLNIELYSKNDDAKNKTHEIAMAIGSYYGQRVQEDNHITIWRNGQILDLTYIDGSSSLHRFRVPVIISYVETKRNDIEVYEHFPNPQTEIDEIMGIDAETLGGYPPSFYRNSGNQISGTLPQARLPEIPLDKIPDILTGKTAEFAGAATEADHATTADSATTATTADFATTANSANNANYADEAGDASTLDGLSAEEFVRTLDLDVMGYLLLGFPMEKKYEFTNIYARNNGFLYDVDSGNLILSGSDGYIYTSDNDGESWTQRTDVSGQSFTILKMDGNLVIFVGPTGIPWLSIDGGVSWVDRSGFIGSIGSICYPSVGISSNIGILGANDGGIYKGNGTTGFVLKQTLDSEVYSLALDDATGILVAGTSAGTIYTSDDDGETWVSRQSLNSHDVTAICCGDNGRYVAGTDFRYLWSSEDNGISWTRIDDQLNYPIESLLFQNKTFLCIDSRSNLYTSFDGLIWINREQLLDSSSQIVCRLTGDGFYKFYASSSDPTAEDGMIWKNRK
jgi:hypothetical protein